METGIFKQLRTKYHRKICENILSPKRDKNSKALYLNLADLSSKNSVRLADLIAKKMDAELCSNPPASQTVGALFGQFTAEFIKEAFILLEHLRPGNWEFSATGGSSGGIANFDQYKHLLDLRRVLDEYPEVKAALGGDYLVVPDIVVARRPVSDEKINLNYRLLEPGDGICRDSPLREDGPSAPAWTLHASISCKWTMRSDRAQNTRTEALNLIRNRKGHTPHIVAVVMEPLPTRIASIAMGSGDIDCTYHGALYELLESVKEDGLEDQADILNTLVVGRRLRDISDLPLDLAI